MILWVGNLGWSHLGSLVCRELVARARGSKRSLGHISGGRCWMLAGWSGDLGWEGFVWLLALQDAEPNSFLHVAVSGETQEESRDCKACGCRGWKSYSIPSAQVSQRLTWIQGVAKETLPLDEESGRKAYCQEACHREGGLLLTGYHSHQSGHRLSGPPPMGSFFLIVLTKRRWLSFKT